MRYLVIGLLVFITQTAEAKTLTIDIPNATANRVEAAFCAKYKDVATKGASCQVVMEEMIARFAKEVTISHEADLAGETARKTAIDKAKGDLNALTVSVIQ